MGILMYHFMKMSYQQLLCKKMSDMVQVGLQVYYYSIPEGLGVPTTQNISSINDLRLVAPAPCLTKIQ